MSDDSKMRKAFEVWYQDKRGCNPEPYLDAERQWGAYQAAYQRFTAEPSPEVVERVARALYANNPATSNSKPMTWGDCFDVFPERIEECLTDAKIVIKAFQEGV